MSPQRPDWLPERQDPNHPVLASIEHCEATVKMAKLRCTNCGKEEHDRKPLQFCSRCRSVRYCDRECQIMHYRAGHKVDCATFKVPPLCRAFSIELRADGPYPEHPIFAHGHSQNSVGAWVSSGGQIDARLAHYVGGRGPGPGLHNMAPEDAFRALPGTSGPFLGLIILVQNRQDPKTTGRVVVRGADIIAVSTPRGSDVLLQGRKPGERILSIEDPDNATRSRAGFHATHITIPFVNGKELLKTNGKHSFIVDSATCSVSLGPGDYAIFRLDYWVGGPQLERDYQALERLAYFEIPYTDVDGKACKFQTKVDYPAVNEWYKDLKEKGEYEYLISHYGEGRTKLYTTGLERLAVLMQRLNGGEQ
ncbi:hypothetical protein BDZ89DRAFT_1063752 [Hymenopellis radicata]|nr:hypothetical protein BDZ89DRAFT_1063752 [Hymenopellis radicata]